MYVPEKLKLNKFRVVNIPRASAIINRLGGRVPLATDCSGDSDMSLFMSKIDELNKGHDEVMRMYDEYMQKESGTQ